MKRVITFQSMLGTVGVTVFILSHIVAVAGAALWAAIGYFRLGQTAAIVLSVIFAIPILIVAAKVAVMAFQAETDPENN